MSVSAEYAKRLQQLLRKLRKQVSELPELPEREPVAQLVHAFLCWEASRHQADKALEALYGMVVDVNELRVCDPDEIVECIGSRYPRAQERAFRLKLALHDIYTREHQVDLSSVAAKSKRDARTYLESLEGMVPYVSASVVLLSLGGHAIPLDEQLFDRLRKEDVVDEHGTLEEAQAFLEHQIRADDGIESHLLLRAYVERPVKVSLDKPSAKLLAAKKKAAEKIERDRRKAAEQAEKEARKAAERAEKEARAAAKKAEAEKKAAAKKKAKAAAAKKKTKKTTKKTTKSAKTTKKTTASKRAAKSPTRKKKPKLRK